MYSWSRPTDPTKGSCLCCSIDLKPRLSVLNLYVRQEEEVSNFWVTNLIRSECERGYWIWFKTTKNMSSHQVFSANAFQSKSCWGGKAGHLLGKKLWLQVNGKMQSKRNGELILWFWKEETSQSRPGTCLGRNDGSKLLNWGKYITGTTTFCSSE